MADIEDWRERYKQLTELTDIFTSIDAVKQRGGRRRKTA